MKKTYTVENTMVKPLNHETLIIFLSKYFTLKEGEEFILDNDSLFFNTCKVMLIDSECCSGYLEKEFNKSTKSIEWCLKIGIRRSKISNDGTTSYPMSFECYFPIFQTDLIENNLLLSEVPLKDFMGRRYNYNPRIQQNTYRVLKAINKDSI